MGSKLIVGGSCWEDVLHLAHYREGWWAVVNRVTKRRVMSPRSW
jgi:hypothetical protein